MSDGIQGNETGNGAYLTEGQSMSAYVVSVAWCALFLMVSGGVLYVTYKGSTDE